MKRFGWIALCLILVIGLCACKKEPDEPVISTPASDVSDQGDNQSTTSTTTTESTSASSSTSSTLSTTSTTKPTQQDISNAVSLPAEGYTPDNRIKLGEVTLADDLVTMVIKNISAVWESEDGKSYFEYTCYDKNNHKLEVGKIEFGYIPAKGQKICSFVIPENTVKVELTDFQVEYWSIPV